jgi:hypothetical protein
MFVGTRQDYSKERTTYLDPQNSYKERGEVPKKKKKERGKLAGSVEHDRGLFTSQSTS